MLGFFRSSAENEGKGGGGQGGIRTHEGLAPLPVFKTGAFNHSATPPTATGFSASDLILKDREGVKKQEVAEFNSL